MVKGRLTAFLLLFSLLVFFAGCGGCTGGSVDDDSEAIRQVLEGYFSALNGPDRAKAYGYVVSGSPAAGWLRGFFEERVPFAQSQGVRYEYSFTIEEIKVLEGGKEARAMISYTFRAVGAQSGLSAPNFETTIELQKRDRVWRITVASLAT